MGCGVLSFGLCAISAGWLTGAPDGAHINVTIYNVGAFFGSLFHALGALLSLSERPSEDGRAGGKAREVFRWERARVSLVILDLIMPDTNGRFNK